MKLPILDLTRQYQGMASSIEEALQSVLASGNFILGPRGAELEDRIARRLGARAAVGVASGSDALLLSLMALHVAPGDEVVTSPYTFFATAGSIARLHARPVFVDVRDDYLLDLGRLPGALSSRTKAFVPVHLFGRALDIGPVLPMLGERGIAVVEDAAQAIGATTPSGSHAGTLAELGILSFYPTKNLGAYGDAGMVLATRQDLADRVGVLRAHGARERYHHAEVGCNSRLDELQAAILLQKLPHLDAWNERRLAIARHYRHAITSPHVILPEIPSGGASRHVFHQFVIRHPDRDRLRERLADAGIGTSVFYPVPLHLQECFRHLGHGAGDFPVAERLARESLALPIFPEMTDAEVELVSDAINHF